MSEARLPVYTAVKEPSGTCTFYCPECDLWHIHGAPERDGSPEHRIAHCHRRGAHRGGYMIVTPALGQQDSSKRLSFVRADRLDPPPRVPDEMNTPVVNGHLKLHWIGGGYGWNLERIQTPHDLLHMMHHLMCKSAERTDPRHYLGLIEAVYRAKGWNIHGAAPPPGRPERSEPDT